MSDYFHEETVKELEYENRFLKAQRDELLKAAKTVFQLWHVDAAAAWHAFKQLEDVIKKTERHLS